MISPEGGAEIYLYSFFNLGARWRWVVNATPRPLHPRQRNAVPLFRRLGKPQDRSGRVQKISPPTRIQSPDPQAYSESLRINDTNNDNTRWFKYDRDKL